MGVVAKISLHQNWDEYAEFFAIMDYGNGFSIKIWYIFFGQIIEEFNFTMIRLVLNGS